MSQKLNEDIERLSQQFAGALAQRAQQDQHPALVLNQKVQDRTTMRRFFACELFTIYRQSNSPIQAGEWKDTLTESETAAKACVTDADSLIAALERSEDLDREELSRKMAQHLKPANVSRPTIVENPPQNGRQ